jgi:hypothetical protein
MYDWEILGIDSSRLFMYDHVRSMYDPCTIETQKIDSSVSYVRYVSFFLYLYKTPYNIAHLPFFPLLPLFSTEIEKNLHIVHGSKKTADCYRFFPSPIVHGSYMIVHGSYINSRLLSIPRIPQSYIIVQEHTLCLKNEVTLLSLRYSIYNAIHIPITFDLDPSLPQIRNDLLKLRLCGNRVEKSGIYPCLG